MEGKRRNVPPWFWPALLGAAIAAGALVEWIRSSPAPAPGGSPPAAIPQAVPAPDAGAPRPYVAPAPPAPPTPPVPRSEYPRARPAPGSEPRVPLTGEPGTDRRRALANSARQWAQSVRGVRPEILDQMREGKRLERERILRSIDEAEAAARQNPNNPLARRRLQALQDDLYYLEQSLDQLETVRQEAR